MINELNVLLSDKGIRLSKPVRLFCEKCTDKNQQGEGLPAYRTMAEAWVHLVLTGMKFPNRRVELEPSSKDPIRWRFIPNDWQQILLLQAFSEDFTFDIDLEELGIKCMRKLEQYADIGIEMLDWDGNE